MVPLRLTLEGAFDIAITCQITLDDLDVVFFQVCDEIWLVLHGRRRSEDGDPLERLSGSNESGGDMLADGPGGSDDEDRRDGTDSSRGHGVTGCEAVSLC